MALAFLFYYWTGTTEGDPIQFGTHNDPYNQLTDAFLRGHLSLLASPPRGLLALKNPYDPNQDGQWLFRYWDLALYHGHFFLTWGPTPVLTLLMPWRLLHVGDMPLNLAVIIYSCVGLLFAVALCCYLVDRYIPETKNWQVAVATLALAFSSVVPYLLRRPISYELAIASGYCFAMLGAYLLASGGLGPRRRPWRLAGGSLSVGLAIGGRPSLAPEAVLLMVLLVMLLSVDGTRTWRRMLRLGGLLLAPCAVVVGLLLAYNAARFGSPLQIGTRYTLDIYDPSKLPTLQLSYLGPGVRDYLAIPVRWTYAFPYFTLPLPAAYTSSLPRGEITGGLLSTTPIVFAILFAVPLLVQKQHRDIGRVVLAITGVGVLVMAFVAAAFWGPTMRYEVDFATFFVLAAMLSWFVLLRLKWRRLVAVLGTVLVVFGCVVGVAISLTGPYDELRQNDPGTYWALADLTSPLTTAVAMLGGHPVIARVITPVSAANGLVSLGNWGTSDIATTRFGLSAVPVEVDIVSPDKVRATFARTFRRAPGATAGPVEIVVFEHGSIRYFPFGNGAGDIVVSLNRGLNRIKLSAAIPGTSSHGTIITVSGLRFTAARSSPRGRSPVGS